METLFEPQIDADKRGNGSMIGDNPCSSVAKIRFPLILTTNFQVL